ncbi:MAG: HTH domain-containing protein, partial [Campylobacterales bacterium]|nr:HTH domain-containing protein [Campylobacterales bacterium]
MKYKVASDNKKLKERAFLSFNSSGFKEAKHIQEVDFWLVDLKNISQQTLSTYKNKQNYSFVLFLVNSQEEIEHCLENGFTNYLNEDFKTTELKAWCKYYKKSQGNVHISKEEILDFNSRSLLFQSSSINLTLQEFNLLKTLSSGEFFTTKELADIISVESTTSVRTLINRIRSKTDKKFIIQKRGFGYRLNSKKREENSEVNSYLDDLEEEKKILQSIVDSSSIFIVTFIHKKLYCINESFR